jgi:hypothetical protein
MAFERKLFHKMLTVDEPTPSNPRTSVNQVPSGQRYRDWVRIDWFHDNDSTLGACSNYEIKIRVQTTYRSNAVEGGVHLEDLEAHERVGQSEGSMQKSVFRMQNLRRLLAKSLRGPELCG